MISHVANFGPPEPAGKPQMFTARGQPQPAALILFLNSLSLLSLCFNSPITCSSKYIVSHVPFDTAFASTRSRCVYCFFTLIAAFHKRLYSDDACATPDIHHPPLRRIPAPVHTRESWCSRRCALRPADSRCGIMVEIASLRRHQAPLHGGRCCEQTRLLATNISQFFDGAEAFQSS